MKNTGFISLKMTAILTAAAALAIYGLCAYMTTQKAPEVAKVMAPVTTDQIAKMMSDNPTAAGKGKQP